MVVLMLSWSFSYFCSWCRSSTTCFSAWSLGSFSRLFSCRISAIFFSVAAASCRALATSSFSTLIRSRLLCVMSL